MVDLSVEYSGIKLKNPIVASSSPLGEDIGSIQELEKKGIAAIVLPSLFEEQEDLEKRSQFLLYEENGYRKYLDYYFDILKYKLTPEKYMEFIAEIKNKVNIPIIGSLNGVSVGGWINNAISMEEAGADAIELNIYFLPTNPDMDGKKVEENYLELVDQITSSVAIPVGVKIHPYLSSIPNMVKALGDAGASAVVIFNRFYQPDINLEKMTVEPGLKLSNSEELLLRIRWAAILYGNVRPDIAITGGVHSARDIVKSILAGAKVTMLASVLLEKGKSYAESLLQDLEKWLEDKNYQSISQICGTLSQKSISEPAVFERANYLKVLDSYPREDS
jgi:dihydroorotate dehydrogenase (fumarate)